MADSRIAFEKLILFEGYVLESVANDPGGETFAGITRKYEASWSGWTFIDAIKKRNKFDWNGDTSKKTIVIHECVSDTVIREHAFEYYDTLFREYLLTQIVSQPIANQIFQAVVNCGPRGIRWSQTAANQMNDIAGKVLFSTLEEDGEIGPRTVNAINLLTAEYEKQYTHLFCDVQKDYYQARVDHSPVMGKFLKGWNARADAFAI